MDENKKLYLVTCSGYDNYSTKNKKIYIIAEDFNEAEKKAMEKIKEWEYQYTYDFVSNIKVIAEQDQYSENIIII